MATATVRRVRRVIRKFDPWTVFKVSLLFHVVFAAATLIGLLLMWSLVERAGIPASLDQFLITISLVDDRSVFFDNGSRFIRVAIFFSVVFGAAMILLSTLAAVIYNLTSDVVGGVEVVMLEETLQVPAPAIPGPPDPGPDTSPEDSAEMPTLAN
ncbi:MAG: DUF3566 domain-containing protein [Acidimicrobiia bacterium]|nr:DUF3566 domain-containing protein [Acidimicrobiia bacterium]